jgi:nucleoside-diphosphate-sugar epimerase
LSADRARRNISVTGTKGTPLIAGASAGIGAIYADRLARRGYDLLLVARNRSRLAALAQRLRDETGRSVEAIAADLNDTADLARIETMRGMGLTQRAARCPAGSRVLSWPADKHKASQSAGA